MPSVLITLSASAPPGPQILGVLCAHSALTASLPSVLKCSVPWCFGAPALQYSGIRCLMVLRCLWDLGPSMPSNPSVLRCRWCPGAQCSRHPRCSLPLGASVPLGPQSCGAQCPLCFCAIGASEPRCTQFPWCFCALCASALLSQKPLVLAAPRCFGALSVSAL
ncbi:UNVERIFIED_CONTAM: hypothetical protein FKN15_045953 [Acipenser sinensis]